MTTDLAKVAAERGIKYFLISYVDLFSTVRAKLVPAAAIGDMAKSGAGFAGFASWLDMTPAEPRRVRYPRRRQPLSSFLGKRRSAWLAADSLPWNGKLVEQAPRRRLEAPVARCGGSQGLTSLKTGVECEFFLISPDGSTISRTPSDHPPRSRATTSRR